MHLTGSITRFSKVLRSSRRQILLVCLPGLMSPVSNLFLADLLSCSYRARNRCISVICFLSKPHSSRPNLKGFGILGRRQFRTRFQWCHWWAPLQKSSIETVNDSVHFGGHYWSRDPRASSRSIEQDVFVDVRIDQIHNEAKFRTKVSFVRKRCVCKEDNSSRFEVNWQEWKPHFLCLL